MAVNTRVEAAGAAGKPPFPDMVWIPGGTFQMVSDQHYSEERPVHRAAVDGFWMDLRAGHQREVCAFRRETGHTTFAEIPPDPAQYPGALPEMLLPDRSSSSSQRRGQIRVRA